VRGVTVVPGDGGEGGDAEPVVYLIEAERRPTLAADVVTALVGRGLAVSELTEAAPDLERTFLDLTRRPAKAAA
jgi:ABC-2 type transport system ATP-binding protein